VNSLPSQRDVRLYRQGLLITTLSRWISVGLAFVALYLLWDSPKVQRFPALATGLVYSSFAVAAFAWMRRHPGSRRLKMAHDFVDALAIGTGAAFSGGLEGPVWLLLYPHVAAVSARRGLVYALVVGCLDATILLLLVRLTPGYPIASLHALALVACGVMGGTTSSYLHQIQSRLARANAELSLKEKEIRRQAERLDAINHVASAVNLSLSTEDICNAAAGQTRSTVPFDSFTVALLKEDGHGVGLVVVGNETRQRDVPLQRDELGWAFRGSHTWCSSPDGGPSPQHAQSLLAEPDVLSVATMPLHSKSGVIGSMSLGRLEATPFTDDDLSMLESVASHLATALDNARLLTAVRKRSQEFRSLLEIGRGILERLDPSELLPLVTRSVNELMGTHYCILMLREGDLLQVGAQEGVEPEIVESLGGTRVGHSLSGWVAEHGESLAVADMREDPRLQLRKQVEDFGYRSFLCVPLRRGAEILGTLEVVTKEVRHFAPEDEELMSAFADQAALAMDQARLFEQTRTHLGELQAANRRLKELDLLRQQYLHNVSHEFRTPLTVIRGYAEFLGETEPPGVEALQRLMHVIVESCDRVIDLVDTLLEVGRVEQEMAGETLKIQDLCLEDVISTSLERLRPLAEKKGIAIALEVSGSPLTLQGDRGLLQQVVRRLVDNAVKYSSAGGKVVVRGLPENDGLTVEVQDSGQGIAPEHLGRIFEKFYMVDGGVARQVGGTGVGLYLVREIVRLHKGEIDVHSQPGQGSVFRVTLPRVFQKARSQQALA